MAENTEISEQEVKEPVVETKEKPKSKNKTDKKTKLNEEIEKLKTDLQSETEKHLRVLAEYDNFRKRSQKEREAVYPTAMASAVSEFIPVADNFERALMAECVDPEYKKGMELTYKLLTDSFEKLGVTIYGEKGDAFDPNLHNAVMQVEDTEAETNTISEVFQKGYKLGDKVIRFAMVTVVN